MLELTTWILLPPLFITIFWIVVILLNQYHQKNKKWELLFFLFCGMVAFISSVALFGKYYQLYELIYVPVVLFAMCQFPSFYVYIRTLTNEKGWQQSLMLHFIIPLITAVVAAYIHYFMLNDAENTHFFSEVIVGQKPESEKLKFAFLIDRFSKNSFVILGFFYYWLTNREVRKHRKQIVNYFSSTDEKNLAWIRFFNVSFFFTLAAGVFFHSMDRKIFIDNTLYLGLTFVPLSIFFLGIGFFGNKQNDIYPASPPDESTNNNATIVDLFPDMHNLRFRLERLLNEDKIFLDPEINLPDLTKLLGTNRTYLSLLINQEFGLNFNQFINKYRIEEACKLLLQPENDELTVKEIGEKCGFSTYPSFIRWFREYYETTPGAYRKAESEKTLETVPISKK